jgi:multiple antibiotic resistance protein
LIELDDVVSTFIVLWAVIDPIGTVPVFIAVTKGYDDEKKKKIAKLASYVSFGVLFFFLVVGEIVLKSIGVPLAAFQTSGGIILFLFALNMIFGNSKPEEEMQLIKDEEDEEETAIFPLAIPSIASPGAILAVVLLADNTRHDMSNQLMTGLVVSIILLINYYLMILSSRIHRRIGNSGAIVISKVMGLILASMAANNILMGIKEFFKL